MRRLLNSYWSIPVVFVVGIGLFAMVVYFATRTPYETRPRSVCPSNLKQIALGMFMYSQDYDDKFPPAISGDETVGWANALQPYLKSYQIFQCPVEPNPGQIDPHSRSFTDYWMNKNVEGIKIQLDINPWKTSFISSDSSPNNVIVLGDGDGGSQESTASYAITQLPISWRQTENSPVTRHHGSANYAFADGHVKSLKLGEISRLPSSRNKDVNTFSTR